MRDFLWCLIWGFAVAGAFTFYLISRAGELFSRLIDRGTRPCALVFCNLADLAERRRALSKAGND